MVFNANLNNISVISWRLRNLECTCICNTYQMKYQKQMKRRELGKDFVEFNFIY